MTFSFCCPVMKGYINGLGLSLWGASFLTIQRFVTIGALVLEVFETLSKACETFPKVLEGWDTCILACLRLGTTGMIT